MYWRTILTVLTLVALATAGCGGSGSSGFDVAPLAEDANIDTALQDGRCINEGDLTICPADQSVPAPITPDDHPVEAPVQLDVSSAPLDIAGCAAAQQCTLEVRFVADGIPVGAIYQPAARRSDGNGWDVGAPVQPLSVDEEIRTSIAVQPDDVAQQVAVLVYLSGPAAAPGRIDTLYASGADLVFVSAPTTD